MLVSTACKHGQCIEGVDVAPESILAFAAGSHDRIVTTAASRMREEIDEDDCLDVVVACNQVPIRTPGAVAKANWILHESIWTECIGCLDSGYLPKILTVGGDHSIAMGSISALSTLLKTMITRRIPGRFQSPDPVVFWIDAHTDINSPRTTISGNLHGCPVSLLAGLDADAWSQLEAFSWTRKTLQRMDMSRFLRTDKLVYIGTRDVDPLERDIVEQERILEYTMDRVKECGRNMVAIIEDALRQVDPLGMHPIHVSFDIDGIDPQFAASTGTPVPDGLTMDEGISIIRTLKTTGRLVSMDLVEVNPMIGTTDEVQSTLHAASRLIKAFSEHD